jgi:hypothetical protein
MIPSRTCFRILEMTDYDFLQDLFQNLGDEAFGNTLCVSWLNVGMPV